MQLNNQPFTTLRIAYFKAFDKCCEEIFLDATDEQILNLLAKKHCETVVIQRIENVEVMSVVTIYPTKRKLDVSELKMSKTNEEIEAYNKKLYGYKEKYK